ncbi:DUF2802 domain-containing protein [Shewanella sp. SNU WT4]|nr:DUF2802 domain-containing protein [Shewanella sp. SNU WT4]
MGELLVMVAVMASTLAFFFVIGLVWYVKKLSHRVDALGKIIKASDKHREELKREVIELRSGTIGVGRRVIELENNISQQAAKLEETQEHDPKARLYSRATKMVSLGADVNELMIECELPRAEAELLLRLHRQDV